MTPDQLSERLLDFAVRVGKVADAIPEARLGSHISPQLVRCGTSAGPNYEEACAAESRADFAHKLSSALNELRESRVWIRLIVQAELFRSSKLSGILDKADHLGSIIGKSLVTTKGRPKPASRAGRPPN